MRTTGESHRTVLIADDEAPMREMLAEYLGVHGFEVIEAANGLETLLQVKRARPRAVVLDLRMPRLGGIEALKRIRAFDPSIVVVVFTAVTDPEVHRQAYALGARAVLAKSVNLSDLLAALQENRASTEPSGTSAVGQVTVTTVTQPAVDSTTHVLVVDDDAEIRTTLEEFLDLRGHRASGAADGASAVRQIAAAAPDVVLLDIEMPDLKGTDALPTIRALAPRAAVIMVSGTADEELAKRSLALGAFDYIIKPVDLNYLAQSLEAALAMRQLES